MPYLLLALAILCEVAATTALKFSDGFTKIVPTGIAILGYAAAFYLLSITLRDLGVGFAYAIWAGVGIVLVATLGVTFMGERFDFAGAAGIALIIGGVVVLNTMSSMGGH